GKRLERLHSKWPSCSDCTRWRVPTTMQNALRFTARSRQVLLCLIVVMVEALAERILRDRVVHTTESPHYCYVDGSIIDNQMYEDRLALLASLQMPMFKSIQRTFAMHKRPNAFLRYVETGWQCKISCRRIIIFQCVYPNSMQQQRECPKN